MLLLQLGYRPAEDPSTTATQMSLRTASRGTLREGGNSMAGSQGAAFNACACRRSSYAVNPLYASPKPLSITPMCGAQVHAPRPSRKPAMATAAPLSLRSSDGSSAASHPSSVQLRADMCATRLSASNPASSMAGRQAAGGCCSAGRQQHLQLFHNTPGRPLHHAVLPVLLQLLLSSLIVSETCKYNDLHVTYGSGVVSCRFDPRRVACLDGQTVPKTDSVFLHFPRARDVRSCSWLNERRGEQQGRETKAQSIETPTTSCRTTHAAHELGAATRWRHLTTVPPLAPRPGATWPATCHHCWCCCCLCCLRSA